MIKKYGFLVDSMGINQLAYQLTRSANEYLLTNDSVDVAVFFRNPAAFCIKPNFGVFHMFEGFSYDGFTVATDLSSAQRMLTWPGPNRRNMFFYLNNLEWLHLPQKQYEQLADIYMNPKLNLIARSATHAEIISSVWRPCYGVVENSNFSKFVEVIC